MSLFSRNGADEDQRHALYYPFHGDDPLVIRRDVAEPFHNAFGRKKMGHTPQPVAAKAK